MVKRFERFKSPEGKQLMYESYDRLLRLWGVETEELDIEGKYGKTHFIIAGNRANPPLMLFHGTGTNSAMEWLTIIQELVKYFFVIAMDSLYKGAGKSEPNKNYLKELDLSLWADEILDALDINKINIAGISYGGYMALAYTAKNPTKVSKVVNMSCYLPKKDLKSYFLLLRSFITCCPEVFILSEGNALKLLKKICGPKFDVFSLNQEYLKHWYYVLKYSKIDKGIGVMKFDNEAISVFRAKVLFLMGDYDRIAYHPSVIKTFDENNLKYKIFKNTGHGIHIEQPELVSKAIVDFLLQD